MTKPNGDAWAHALGWAGVVYVVLLVVMVPRSDQTAAFTAGRMMVPALAAWVITWAIAASTSKRWSWWPYPLLVLAVAGAVFFASNVRELTDSERFETFDRPDAGTSPDEAGPVIGELKAPSTGGDWVRVENPQIRQELDRLQQGMQSAGSDIDSVIAAYYTHRDPKAAVILVGINGTLEADHSLESSLRSGLAGANVDDYETYDPGAAGGVLGCGNAAAQGHEWFACMWLGNQRAVFAQWQDRSLEPAVAATLTTELRDLASAG